MAVTSRNFDNAIVTAYEKGILQGNRVLLGQAITLIESNKKEDRIAANQLIEKILPATGNSLRIGITGSPGVGKSTWIENFGKYLTEVGKKIAVLAIDPSSTKTKGSILGDKTRMEILARNPMAFIRPTATGSVLGGVANRTKESILLCEAAGYDVILVETVGVGQSETAVRDLVDFFLLLTLAGAGDELQGIKKGIMEMADSIVITKADGENTLLADRAKHEYQQALHLIEAADWGWIPKVLTASAIEGKGISEVWELISAFHYLAVTSGHFCSNREAQDITWFHRNLGNLIQNELILSVVSKEEIRVLESKIKSKEVSPIHASEGVLSLIKKRLMI